MLNTNRRKAPKVLLVDYATERRLGLKAGLTEQGFHVMIAGDAQAALDESAAEETPAVVLIDGGLPGQGAAEVCRALRSRPAQANTSILVMLERAELDGLAGMIDAGASDVVEKPCHPALLAHRIKSSLDARAERRTLRALAGAAGTGEHDAFEPADDAADAARFLSRLGDAIVRAKKSDQSVAILYVAIHGSPGSPGNTAPDGQQLMDELRRAVSQFESEEALTHAKGRVQVSPIEGACHAILIPELGRVQDAAKLGTEVLACIRRPFHLACDVAGLEVHIGIATYPADGFQAADLLQRAKSASEAAKHEGSTHLQFFNGSMNRWAFERLTLEQNLRQALERGELTVYYQPKMEILTRKVIGVEALVRWKHPTLGMISPGQFIPLAEETGLIVPIGEFVLDEATRQNMAWQKAGFEPIRMAVNLSPAQFRRPDLFESVKRLLDFHGMSPEWLEFELTEGMLMHDAQATIQILGKLKQTGIHLSIDDFGTGYSSLSYLKRFPIDALKIDQSFVRDVTTNPEDAAIATSIILMGHSLKLNVIAEGVETDSQLSFLKILQCNEVQGYLVSPPVPPERAEAFLTQGARA